MYLQSPWPRHPVLKCLGPPLVTLHLNKQKYQFSLMPNLIKLVQGSWRGSSDIEKKPTERQTDRRRITGDHKSSLELLSAHVSNWDWNNINKIIYVTFFLDYWHLYIFTMKKVWYYKYMEFFYEKLQVLKLYFS